MSRSRRPFAFIVVLGLAFVPIAGHAADPEPGPVVEPPASVAPPLSLGGSTVAPPTTVAGATATVASLLTEGRTAIAAKKWPDAIIVLTRAAATEPANADVQNLLGYSNRNNGNYTAALTHYAAALKINPKHVGALEYQGIAFVQLGQTAKARANLATLQKVCGTKCPEYKDLAAALKSAPKSKKKY